MGSHLHQSLKKYIKLQFMLHAPLTSMLQQQLLTKKLHLYIFNESLEIDNIILNNTALNCLYSGV
jgi:hypothetical protein